MDYRIETREAITVRGVSELKATDDNNYCALWDKFMGEKVVDTVEGKTGKLYGVYTEYSADLKGKYLYLVGAGVAADTPAQEGLTERVLPAGKYAVFTAKDMADIGPVWQKVWSGNLDRTFIADYEEYDEKGGINVYVGIK